MPSCMRAPPEVGTTISGNFFCTARCEAATRLSPTATPNGAAHKAEIERGDDGADAADAAFADDDGVRHAGFLLRVFQSFAVAFLIAEFKRIDHDRRDGDGGEGVAVEQKLKAASWPII